MCLYYTHILKNFIYNNNKQTENFSKKILCLFLLLKSLPTAGFSRIDFGLIALLWTKKWSEQSSEQQARLKNIINEILLFVNSLLN